MHPPDTTQDYPIGMDQLEHQVETLVDACLQLREENASLRQHQEALLAEKPELIEKTELARTRVESMITRLKAMEYGL